MSEVTATPEINEKEKSDRAAALIETAVQMFLPCIVVHYDPKAKTLEYKAPPQMEAALLKVFEKYIVEKPGEESDIVVE